jgi:hypothetical protein
MIKVIRFHKTLVSVLAQAGRVFPATECLYGGLSLGPRDEAKRQRGQQEARRVATESHPYRHPWAPR